MPTSFKETRAQAIRYVEHALANLQEDITEARREIAKMETEQEAIRERLEVLRTEPDQGYSSAIFHVELAQHGCIACASARAGGGQPVRVHNGRGPDCPTRRGQIVAA